jgi:hypothetical protein
LSVSTLAFTPSGVSEGLGHCEVELKYTCGDCWAVSSSNSLLKVTKDRTNQILDERDERFGNFWKNFASHVDEQGLRWVPDWLRRQLLLLLPSLIYSLLLAD